MATYTSSAAYSGSVRYSTEDLRPDAILLTWTAIVLETRIQRYIHFSTHCRVEYRVWWTVSRLFEVNIVMVEHFHAKFQLQITWNCGRSELQSPEYVELLPCSASVWHGKMPWPATTIECESNTRILTHVASHVVPYVVSDFVHDIVLKLRYRYTMS